MLIRLRSFARRGLSLGYSSNIRSDPRGSIIFLLARTCTTSPSPLPSIAAASSSSSSSAAAAAPLKRDDERLTYKERRFLGLILPCLQRFKHLRGHTIVNQSFVVPFDKHDEWPDERHWGLKLGRCLDSIRHKGAFKQFRAELLAVGVNFGDKDGCLKVMKLSRFDLIRSALLRYKSEHGNVLVPSSFKVPTGDDSWPKQTWGMTLGRSVNSVRNYGAYKLYRQELVEMGFDFGRQVLKFEDGALIAMQIYKRKFGNLLVPTNFTVPLKGEQEDEKDRRRNKKEESTDEGIKGIQGCDLFQGQGVGEREKEEASGDDDDEWPDYLRGFHLGHTVYDIRNNGSYKEHRELLLKMGFDYGPQLADNFPLVFRALQHYKSIYGNLRVPFDFFVPRPKEDKQGAIATGQRANHLNWPDEEMWGYHLGKAVFRIRNVNCFVDKRKELEAIGFDYTSQSEFSDPFLACSQLYTKRQHRVERPKGVTKITHTGLASMSEDVIINNYPLGKVVSQLREIANQHAARHPSTRINTNAMLGLHFFRILEALRLFKQQKGTLQVKRSFAVPLGSEKWPEMFWGLELGIATCDLRRHGRYAQQQVFLDEIGFYRPNLAMLVRKKTEASKRRMETKKEKSARSQDDDEMAS